MFELFISFIIILSIVFSSGLIFSKIIFHNSNNKINLFEIGLLGVFFYIFLSFIIHFFLPLSKIVNLIVCSSLLLIATSKLDKEILNDLIKNKLVIFFSFILVIIMSLKYKPNEDYGFYHLPYIINLVSEKIIFGLSNLQPQYAWNSTWLNFSSNFYLPIIGLKGTQLSNSILYFFSVGLFLHKLFIDNNKKDLTVFFLYSILTYVLIKFARISEHGFDFPANLFLLISFFYFIQIFKKKNFISEKDLILFLIFSKLSITIKLNTIPLVLLLFATFINLLIKKYNFSKITLPLIFISLFFTFWLIQQFIYTSCLLPFVEFTCLKSSAWFNKELIEALKNMTGAINKSYWQYTGTLSEIEYSKNFNWVSTWFNRNKIEISEHLLAILIPLFILIILNLKNFTKRKNNYVFQIHNYLNFYILLFILAGLLMWFLKSPVYRFGMPYIFLASIFLIFTIIKFFFQKIELKKGILLLICLSFTFNISKNLIRIFKLTDQNTVWPNIINVNYSTKKIGEFEINYPDSKIKSTQHNLCWSVPFICDINKGTNIEIKKKSNYFIIIK